MNQLPKALYINMNKLFIRDINLEKTGLINDE